MKFHIDIFFKAALFIVVLLTVFNGKSYASTKDCIDNINKDRADILKELGERGNYFYWKCGGEYPYLFITITDLDDSENKIDITHSPKKNDKYLLKNITDHVSNENVLIAINGFTWEPDDRCAGGRAGTALAIVAGRQCAFDAGYGSKKGYASNPTGTVLVNSEIIHTRTDGKKEASIGFAIRSENGTSAKLTSGYDGLQVESGFKETVDSVSKSIMKAGLQSDSSDDYYDRVSGMGIGEFEDKNVLILISSSNDEPSRANDHYKIFDTLGATDAIRLDGGTAASLYFQGGARGHVNPLEDQTVVKSDARKIMYALTVSRVDPIVLESKIEFEDVKIEKWIDYGEPIPFSGKVVSEQPISKISMVVEKPDGGYEVDTKYYEDDIVEINFSEFSFGEEDYVDESGRYIITIVVEDESAYEARKELSVEVIPVVTQVNLYPQLPFIEEASSLVVSGEKLNSDVTAKIGLKDESCELSRSSDVELTFTCVAYELDIYRIRVYYKYGQDAEYVLSDERHRYVECNSEERSIDPDPVSCGEIANGTSTRTRTCSDLGQWGAYGTCTISCSQGYHRSGNMCVSDTPTQICTPESTENRSCSITNGSGIDSRTCASDGMSWGAYEGCTASSCDAGYVISGNACVEESSDDTYEFYLTNATLDKTSVEAGKIVKASVTSNYSGNVRDRDMRSVNIRYYLSPNTSLSETDIILGDDSSGLGSDDTSDNEDAELTIPSSTPSGDYYVLFVINYDKQFPENNEGNNVEYVSIAVTNASVDQYDFYIENARLNKTSAYPGDEVKASMDVSYSGNVLDKDMGRVKTAYYLIAANGTSEELGSDTSNLGSDDTSESESLSFTLPLTLEAGTYFVGFITDYDKQYTETNEDNNGALVKIEVEGEQVAPSINRLDPVSPKVYPKGSYTRRTAYLYGNNFKAGASVRLCWSVDCHTLNTGFSSEASYSEVQSSSAIKIYFSPGDTPDNWNVIVTNPDGERSNTFNFSTSY